MSLQTRTGRVPAPAHASNSALPGDGFLIPRTQAPGPRARPILAFTVSCDQPKILPIGLLAAPGRIS